MAYEQIEARLAEVLDRIAAACERAGRAHEDVTVVAVTKGHPAAAVRAALAVSLADVGENRVQELEDKVSEVGRASVRWHLIGNLQRNKVKRTLPLFDLMHSLDSVRLARKLSEEAETAGTETRVLVQVNAAKEDSKSGFEPEALMRGLSEICALPRLRVDGLMTMAPFTSDESVLRATFSRVRELRDEAVRRVDGFHPMHLSMGMSNDYELAVEEGSTLVRLGTVLFGEREQ
jgi:pyridoxal phosphate enzyme (YggS family)